MTNVLSKQTTTAIQIELVFRPMPYEVDFTGFLSNTVAPKWMEELRIELMDKHFPRFDTGTSDHLSVIAETQIKYIKPARYGNIVHGRAWLDNVSYSRWVICFDFYLRNDNSLIMHGHQVGVFINPLSLLPVRIPVAIKNLFSAATT